MEKKFFKRQIGELQQEKYYAFWRKLKVIFFICLAPLCVLIVRILRPLIVIRFGMLKSSRIGHFAANTELYLCERDMHIQGRRTTNGERPSASLKDALSERSESNGRPSASLKSSLSERSESNGRSRTINGERSRTIDIFYHGSPICNQQMRKMWERKLCVLGIARWIDILNRYLPGASIHRVSLVSDQDFNNLLARIPAHLAFTEEEERRGQEKMQELGIKKDSPFVCFFARDSAYLDTVLPFQDWRYHGYRDCNIQNYIPAVKELTQRGYYAVRMGSKVKEALEFYGLRIIDYSVNGRSDFLDIFLSAKCRFFISSTGGINAVARIFRRPIVYVNLLPLGVKHLFSCAPGSLFIPKKLWSKEKRSFLTFREISNLGAGGFFHCKDYEESAVEAIENTPEEIISVVTEMDERLKAAWRPDKEDDMLQQNFWAAIGIREQDRRPLTRIGADFLRRNQDLFK